VVANHAPYSALLRHHDVGTATGESENDLGGQHLAQHIADKGAVPDQGADVAAEAAALGAVTARLGQRQRDGDGDRERARGDRVEDRAPAKGGLDQAAGQGG
jgi:hypothetical protein